MSQTMTVRQRLLAALALKEPDRLPITLYGVYPYSHDDWRYQRPSYRPLLDFAREQTDPFCLWNVEHPEFYTNVPIRTRTLEGGAFAERTVETPLGPISTITNTSPATQWTRKHYCQNQEDIDRFMSIRYEPARPDLTPALELERSVGEKALMYIGLLDPIAIVGDLFEPEDFAIRCITETATIKKMIEKVSEHVCDYVQYLLDHGPRSIYMIAGAEYATAPLLAPRYFDEFVIPFDTQLVDLIQCHGSWPVIHCHGQLDGVLERIADMGAVGLHPMEAPPMGDVPLAEVKRRVGDRLCLIGNIQIGDVIALAPEEIDQQVGEAVKDGAAGGGFILSITASPYEEELSPRALANYMQIVESARKYH